MSGRAVALLRATAAAVIIAAMASPARARSEPASWGVQVFIGHHLAGPALSLGLEGRVPISDRLRVAVAGRVTGALASVPVEGGSARVPNVAFHATAGLDGALLR